MRTKGRLPRPGEVPAFGSVWTWGDGVMVYIVLSLGPGPGEGQQLHYLDYRGDLDPFEMQWSTYTGEVMPMWRCVDEGPK